MVDRARLALGRRMLTVCFTNAGDGDFRVVDPRPDLDARRRAVIDGPWSWLRQVHGADVHRVEQPGDHAGDEGDGLWTDADLCPISVTTADCGPVVLAGSDAVAVVHAGWRGLMAGVVENAAASLDAAGSRPVATMLGPCIHPAGYQFGEDDLAAMADRFGPSVVGSTTDGDPALDLPAAVAAACTAVGWPEPAPASCTSDPRWFSHRTRADVARQVAVAWLSTENDGL